LRLVGCTLETQVLEVVNGACCIGTVCCKFVFRRVVGGVMYCSVHSLPLIEEHRNEEAAIIEPIAISNGFFPRTTYKLSLKATHKQVITQNETTADNLTFSFHSPAVRKVPVFSETFLST